MATKRDVKSDFVAFGYAAALTGVALFIRELYGLETLKRLLPYLIAFPSAFVIVQVVRVFGGLQRKATTPFARLQIFYTGTLFVIWIVATGLALFQPWLNPQLWLLMTNVALIILEVVPKLMHSRRNS